MSRGSDPVKHIDALAIKERWTDLLSFGFLSLVKPRHALHIAHVSALAIDKNGGDGIKPSTFYSGVCLQCQPIDSYTTEGKVPISGRFQCSSS
jgi:hypothetical protein